MRTLVLVAAVAALCSASSAAPPNIVVILADDLGYSDLGCYGGEIETPVLDRLAAEGLRFSQFYNTGRCWPTRASLLTGFYAQEVRRDRVAGMRGGGGNRGKRPAWAPLLPERLATAGYRSYHSGKWHLDGMPLEEGFDRSYYLKDQGRFFSPQVHHLDDVKLPPVARGSGFYGTVEVADRAIEFLREHARDHAGAPFFSYLAFAAPHFPLHALPEDIAVYRGRYTDGWEAVRSRRFARQQSAGLFGAPPFRLADPEPGVGPPYHFPDAFETLGPGEVRFPVPWRELDDRQRRFQAQKMELHAAMVHRMDGAIGRVLAQIEAMGARENTLVVFLSDNGASAEIMVRSDGHDPEAPPGSAASYLCLGPGWSTASNTPFRRHKTWNHEGGIATPFVVSWPEGIRDAGSLRHTPGHVIDLVPTVLALAGIGAPPGPGVPPLRGTDLAPVLAGDAPADRPELWWAHEGNRAFRQGDWKIVAAGEDAAWELYNLAEDRAETRDLAADDPGRVRDLAAGWDAVRAEMVGRANGGSSQ